MTHRKTSPVKIHYVISDASGLTGCGRTLSADQVAVHCFSDLDLFKRQTEATPGAVCKQCVKGLQPKPVKQHSEAYHARKHRRQVALNKAARRYARNVRLGRTGVRY